MIARTWPTGLATAATLPTTGGTPRAQVAVMDSAPLGHRYFVYPRQRGEAPLCRLEMKFPRQKEVFYLRHILLHFPKDNFRDCRTHRGVVHPTYEETLLATGVFGKNEEAHAVFDEIISLRYTAKQLRFAFLVLLEQDASPVTLFKAYERPLMKDYIDNGLSPDEARRRLIIELRASWMTNGNTSEAWPLDLALDASTRDHNPHTTTPPQNDRSLDQLETLIFKNADQTRVATHLQACLSETTDHYIFVEGRAGTGKSTLATYMTLKVDAT